MYKRDILFLRDAWPWMFWQVNLFCEYFIIECKCLVGIKEHFIAFRSYYVDILDLRLNTRQKLFFQIFFDCYFSNIFWPLFFKYFLFVNFSNIKFPLKLKIDLIAIFHQKKFKLAIPRLFLIYSAFISRCGSRSFIFTSCFSSHFYSIFSHTSCIASCFFYEYIFFEGWLTS